jgi:hypothetical protein
MVTPARPNLKIAKRTRVSAVKSGSCLLSKNRLEESHGSVASDMESTSVGFRFRPAGRSLT